MGGRGHETNEGIRGPAQVTVRQLLGADPEVGACLAVALADRLAGNANFLSELSCRLERTAAMSPVRRGGDIWHKITSNLGAIAEWRGLTRNRSVLI